MFALMNVNQQYENDPKLKREDVRILAEWLEKQPHLPKPTELQLTLFLQSCYYRIEAAKSTIDNFYTVRSLCPDIFGAPSLETLKFQFSISQICSLPEKTPEGHFVKILRFINPNPDFYNCVQQINYSDLCLMLDLHQRGTVEGIVIIFDSKHLSFGHMTKMNLVAIKKHLFFVQEAAPLRIKGIHYVNVVSFIDKLMAMVRPFMKKELIDLINFHSDLESLYKVVPQKILPIEYGGEGPSMNTLHEQRCKNLLDNYDFFKWLDTQTVDESKRPGKPKNSSELFGVDGTFKKLEVD